MSESKHLSDRLGQYSITAQGQIARGRSFGDIAGYAAAAGAGLVMAGGADAAIIYSGVQNVSVQIDPTLQGTSPFNNSVGSAAIDMDGGGDDVNLRLNFIGNNPGTLSGVTTSYYGIAIVVGAGGGEFLAGTTNNSASVNGANFAAGAVIGGGVFSAGSAGLVHSQKHIGSAASSAIDLGNFQLGQIGFVGIQLASGNYGWIRLLIEDLGDNNPFGGAGGLPGTGYPDRITAIDWAYEDSGAPIYAGAVPVPTPLALLAAGALGLAAFRRRKTAPAQHA